MNDREQETMSPLHRALKDYVGALDRGDVLAALTWENMATRIVEELKAAKVRLPVELDPLLRAAAK